MNQTFNAEQRQLLEKLWHEMNYLAHCNPPGRWHPAWVDYCLEIEHGPRYRPSEWFGPMGNPQRQRYLRALESLERDGFLICHRGRSGRRLSHAKLTVKGLQAVQTLDEATR